MDISHGNNVREGGREKGREGREGGRKGGRGGRGGREGEGGRGGWEYFASIYIRIGLLYNPKLCHIVKRVDISLGNNVNSSLR